MKVSKHQARCGTKKSGSLRRRSLVGLLVGLVLTGIFFVSGDGGVAPLILLTPEQEAALKGVSRPVPVAAATAHQANRTETAITTPSFPIQPSSSSSSTAAVVSSPAPKKVIWSRARSDRSGSVIQDMLMCHAYAFHHQSEYGGACIRNWTLPQFVGKRVYHEELLEAVGLSGVLKFDCPENQSTPMQNRNDYIEQDTGIFTNKYLQHLRSLVDYPSSKEQPQRYPSQNQDRVDNEKAPTIAVHIRRGDISPCRPRTRGYPRYLPNQHFLRLIDRYDPSNQSQVTIYSESASFEPFDDFWKRGYQVHLDGSIGKVWRGLLASDILILSRSSFSLVPAILTKAKVVYTPFWHDPLPRWDVVEGAFVNETLTEFKRLKQTCPDPKEAKKKQKQAQKNKKKKNKT